MTNRSELAGSVRPYFGRSLPRETAAVEPRPGDPPVAPESETAADSLSDIVQADSAEDVVRGAARERGWVLVEQPSAVDVVVPVGSERLQTVTARFDHRDELARPTIVFSSCCGSISDQNAAALLRRNARSFVCAFALEKQDDVEIAVLRGTQAGDHLNAAEVARLIEAIAKHAAVVEQRLSQINQS